MSGPFSSSPHVDLLQHAQTHSSATVAVDMSVTHPIDTPMPSPQGGYRIPQFPSPAPSPPPTTVSAAEAIAASLPLPPGWASLRASQLALPSEKRSLPSLRIETGENHALKQGLWIACASMYFPSIIQPANETASQSSSSAVPASTCSSSASSSSSSSAPDSTTSSVPLEAVADIKIPSRFKVSVVEGGITNQLYKCCLSTHSSQPVLVRIYGPRTELVIDRSKENEVVDVLSANGTGPKIFGRFENGRLESWLAGRSCTPAEMREEKLSALIARSLSKLHVQNMPFEKAPVIAEVLNKWAKIAQEVSFPDNAAKQTLLDTLDLPSIIAAKDAYLAELKASPLASASKIVFAHNDLLSGNVMFDATTSSVSLVDFEYGDYNPLGFDIANHFWSVAHLNSGTLCDAMLGITKPKFNAAICLLIRALLSSFYMLYLSCARSISPVIFFSECCGFECDWAVFPSSKSQLWFIRNYLSAVQSTPIEQISDADVHVVFAQVQAWLLAPHLFWLLWAIVQAKHSPIDFDYLSFAHLRWKGFQLMTPIANKWMHKTIQQVQELSQVD